MDLERASNLLLNLIYNNCKKDSLGWLDKALNNIQNLEDPKQFYIYFGAVPRQIGKQNIQLDEGIQSVSFSIRKGWNIDGWRADQMARVLLLLSIPSDDQIRYTEIIERLYQTADFEEQTAIALALPLIPYPENFLPHALLGVRSNIKTVFEATALNNPYPYDHFSEDQWNQMVLKAVFIGSPIKKIWGIDERANSKLAGMLTDFARERWAAGRIVTPELWRPVSKFYDISMKAELEKLITSSNPYDRHAAALIIRESPHANSFSEMLTIEDAPAGWDAIPSII